MSEYDDGVRVNVHPTTLTVIKRFNNDGLPLMAENITSLWTLVPIYPILLEDGTYQFPLREALIYQVLTLHGIPLSNKIDLRIVNAIKAWEAAREMHFDIPFIGIYGSGRKQLCLDFFAVGNWNATYDEEFGLLEVRGVSNPPSLILYKAKDENED